MTEDRDALIAHFLEWNSKGGTARSRAKSGPD